MGVASESIARAIVIGLVRSGAINRDQFEEIVNCLFQEVALVEGNMPRSAEKIERFITGLHHQLRFDQPVRKRPR